MWKGPYNIAAGKTIPLSLEMDLISAPLRNDWSVIVHASVSKVTIAHSDGIPSDAWPVQTFDNTGASTNTTTTTTDTTVIT